MLAAEASKICQDIKYTVFGIEMLHIVAMFVKEAPWQCDAYTSEVKCKQQDAILWMCLLE